MVLYKHDRKFSIRISFVWECLLHHSLLSVPWLLISVLFSLDQTARLAASPMLVLRILVPHLPEFRVWISCRGVGMGSWFCAGVANVNKKHGVGICRNCERLYRNRWYHRYYRYPFLFPLWKTTSWHHRKRLFIRYLFFQRLAGSKEQGIETTCWHIILWKLETPRDMPRIYFICSTKSCIYFRKLCKKSAIKL